MNREIMTFDVVIVGAGPAGLSAGIRLAQLAKEKNQSLDICIIDKAEEISGHLLSGAVLEPRALQELLPQWSSQATDNFLHTAVTKDEFLFLTANHKFKLPTPPQMHNTKNIIISLDDFARYLAKVAEGLGVNIFPGFAATEILYDESETVIGIVTGDKGLTSRGEKKENYQPGIELHAKQIVFAEGCRGSLTKTLLQKFNLTKNSDPQTYGLGLKELWEVPLAAESKGKVIHTIGWPLDFSTYGGSFIYHITEKLVAVGFVIGLDYKNPYLNPYEEFQRFKTHPAIRDTFAQGKRIAYGARTLIEGGSQSIPKLTFPGGVIIGDAAGFLNVAKIKGIHTAMKSGMIAAETIFPDLQSANKECIAYEISLRKSWVWDDLWKVRNIRPAFSRGLLFGIGYSAIDTYLFQGKAPWTFHHKISDHESLSLAKDSIPIAYPKHDNRISFDLSASVFLSNIKYEENQPYHLRLKDKFVTPIKINRDKYASPETRYCPAGVYEIVTNDNNEPRLQINGGNCIHCKACDIKDPTQNITWTPSEGGSGPNYQLM